MWLGMPQQLYYYATLLSAFALTHYYNMAWYASTKLYHYAILLSAIALTQYYNMAW